MLLIGNFSSYRNIICIDIGADNISFCFLQMLLIRYFKMAGSEAELVWPKDTALQEKIRQRRARPLFDDEDGFDYFYPKSV